MHNASIDHIQFGRFVRQALTHLYDQAYLQRLPLAAALFPDASPAVASQLLYRMLIEAIGVLRPPPGLPAQATAWRSYQLLSALYLESLPREKVAEQLAISLRQFSREQSRSLEAVTEILWVKFQQLQSSPGPSQPSAVLLDTELSRLGTVASSGSASPAEVIQSVIATLGPLTNSSNVTVSTPPAMDLPPVAIDRVVLRQALLNVLSYVIEQTHNTIIEVEVSPNEHELQIAVQHRGQTVTTLSDSREDERLSLAAHLLTSQGGRMLRSDDHTAILFFLPIWQPKSVLVVDDNPDVISLFRRYLAGSGLQVVGAADGQQALQLAHESHPSAITLDVMIPTHDGWEILQTLKNVPDTKNIPVIVCSVLRDNSLALSLGANDYLIKPVTQQMLLAALARCLSESEDAEHRG